LSLAMAKKQNSKPPSRRKNEKDGAAKRSCEAAPQESRKANDAPSRGTRSPRIRELLLRTDARDIEERDADARDRDARDGDAWGGDARGGDARGGEKKKGEKVQPRRRRKRIPLGDAMRRAGVDEHRIAERMAGLLEDLGTQGNDAKLLLDAIKESTRALAPVRGGGAKAAPVPIQLHHNVPRPVRTPPEKRTRDDDAKPV
jgi:hypothetical protein